MNTRLAGLCLGLLLVMPPLPAEAARPEQLPPCPPREAGQPRPANCADPCPKGMIGNHPNCTCPPGTVKAERPRSPSERCVKAKGSPPVLIERQAPIFAKCPKGHIGTYPDCHCPPGLMGKNCQFPIVR